MNRNTILINPNINLPMLSAVLRSGGFQIVNRNRVLIIEPMEIRVADDSETNNTSINSIEKLFTFFDSSI